MESEAGQHRPVINIGLVDNGITKKKIHVLCMRTRGSAEEK